MSQPGQTPTAHASFRHFPLNAWYAAAWDHEVTRKPAGPQTIASRPMALYRTTDGRPVALRTPAGTGWRRSRWASSSATTRSSARYHGIRYNSAGRCTSMPAQETINPSATVPSYPVVERHRYVWVWPGDPTLADPDLVPDMHQMDDPEWAGDGMTIHATCNYQLILDNLMDLTHEEFVHGSQHRPGRAERVGLRGHPRRPAP